MSVRASVFLAKEFGVQVWATDLWIAAAENWDRVCEAGAEASVYPIHAEAHTLPFAEGFFDAIVSFDAYHYFGTDDLYLGNHLAPLIRPGGQIGIVVPGLASEFDGDPPAHLAAQWLENWDLWSFHSPDWWRRHWAKTGLLAVQSADLIPDGWRHWLAWDEASLESPQRRPPGLSIPDLEHRRAVARFFLRLVERSHSRRDEGLWSWLGERSAERALGGAVRPDGFGRYLLRGGEILFHLELDRGTEPGRRVGDKLRRYPPALANDEKREFVNVLLVCGGAGRLANLARQAPPGPPWFWGTTDGEHYRLLPRGDERPFEELPALARDPARRVELCLGKRWRRG